jgi:hypothetical protein
LDLHSYRSVLDRDACEQPLWQIYHHTACMRGSDCADESNHLAVAT